MLTPQEVSGRAFSKAAFGGYNMAMVDEFLDELTDDYTSLYKENAALKAKLKVLVDKVEEYRATEDSMRAALLTAQRMANTMVEEAEEKKKAMLAGAEDEARAKKFFNLATEAADKVISSGKFAIVEEFRNLFGSEDLTTSKECILYRKYNASQSITHCVASYCNANEPTDIGPTLDLIKSFICTDGKDWQTSTLGDAEDFSLSSLLKTRDPRFEGTFFNKVTPKNKSAYLYVTKFIPRSALKYLDEEVASPAPEFQGEKNVTGYPVLRYSEVLLNWIEAKAELADLGEGSVSQADIDLSINAIRNRPIASEAKKLGVTKTAAMNLASLNADPSRDATVSPLLWEIRRERRMEFAFEFSRIIDLRRWGKLEYMDTDARPDLLMGTWVNFQSDLPKELKAENMGKIRVVNAAGKAVVYDGKNGASLNGFFYSPQTLGRQPYLDLPNVNPYLCPIGKNQISDYEMRGYKLTQTEGWPTEL